jgi:hypothetical protein
MEIKRRSKNPTQDFIIRLVKNVTETTNCVVELFILNKINKIPIIIYDTDNVIKYVFDESKLLTTKDKEISKYNDQSNRSKFINIRFSLISNNKIPDSIDIIYFP